jgi:hypothetical protein
LVVVGDAREEDVQRHLAEWGDTKQKFEEITNAT